MASQNLTATILVTGSNGQLGSELRILSKNHPEYQFFFTSRSELSIENTDQVRSFFQKNHIVSGKPLAIFCGSMSYCANTPG